jgi:hypothetical protein
MRRVPQVTPWSVPAHADCVGRVLMIYVVPERTASHREARRAPELVDRIVARLGECQHDAALVIGYQQQMRAGEKESEVLAGKNR